MSIATREWWAAHPEARERARLEVTARHAARRASYVPPAEKVCRVCDVLKPLDEFPRHHQCLDGVTNVCKPCKVTRRSEQLRGVPAVRFPQRKTLELEAMCVKASEVACLFDTLAEQADAMGVSHTRMYALRKAAKDRGHRIPPIKCPATYAGPSRTRFERLSGEFPSCKCGLRLLSEEEQRQGHCDDCTPPSATAYAFQRRSYWGDELDSVRAGDIMPASERARKAEYFKRKAAQKAETP